VLQCRELSDNSTLLLSDFIKVNLEICAAARPNCTLFHNLISIVVFMCGYLSSPFHDPINNQLHGSHATL